MPLSHDADIAALLKRTRSIAVIGIKAGPDDDAFEVPAYMLGHSYRILPVSPKLDHILEESCVDTLLALSETPDLVNLYRASDHIPAHTDEILALAPRPLGVWMQLGIRCEASTRRLEAAGIEVVEDRCLMVEHHRLLGRPQ